MQADCLAVSLGAVVALVEEVSPGDPAAEALTRLVATFGTLPAAPSTYHGESGRLVRFFRAPEGIALPSAEHLHGGAPGLSLLTSGEELLPPSHPRGELAPRRWREGHPSVTELPALPSWLALLALEPERARAWAARSKALASEVRPVTSPEGPTVPPDGAEWEGKLIRSRKRVLPTFGNLSKILRNAPEYCGRWTYNLLALEPELSGKPYKESDLSRTREWFEDQWGVTPGVEDLGAAVLHVSRGHAFHPVRDYLSGLVWDRRDRLRDAARELFGNEDPLAGELVARWFVEAAARALDPGCQADSTLILRGIQGAGKSTLFRALADPWFQDTAIDLAARDGLMLLHRCWIYEFSEVDHLTSQRHASQVKQFLTRRVDAFRVPYGRNVEQYPRGLVFVGSTNETQFLVDPTGARRFWPVEAHKVDLEVATRDRDQLWAEAVTLYRAGERWHLDAPTEQERERAADEYRVRDPWEEPVSMWLASKWPEVSALSGRKHLTSWEILSGALKLEPRDARQESTNRLGRVLAGLGYTRRKVRLSTKDAALWTPLCGEARQFVWAWVPSGTAEGEAPE